MIWLGLPVNIVVIILSIIILATYQKHKINLTFSKKKKIRILLSVIGVLLSAFIFILLIACLNAFIENTNLNHLEFTNKLAYYIVLVSPIVPFLLMFKCLVTLFKTIKSKERTITIDKNEKFDINSIEKFDLDKKEDNKKDEVEIL